MLWLFERASGLKVNSKKTEILHATQPASSLCDWPIVRDLKILGIFFPISSRKQIELTMETLHNQISELRLSYVDFFLVPHLFGKKTGNLEKNRYFYG